jgi:hypothetical protein
VSLPWRDEVAIYLAPHRLALVRRARWPRARVLAATELAIPATTGGDHGPVLARLAEALREPIWHGAAARVVVADHPWARYAIVPWPGTRLDEVGRLALARFVLGDTYGEAAADWTLALADTPPGTSFVACGMPTSLRGALEDALAPARLTLASLQPRLIVAFNAWRHRLSEDASWFASVDDGSLSAVHLTRGAWDRVHMARLSADWSVELERLLAFARLTRAAGHPGRLFVHAPDWMRRGVAAGAGLEWLTEGAADGSSAHELALLQGIYA